MLAEGRAVYGLPQDRRAAAALAGQRGGMSSPTTPEPWSPPVDAQLPLRDLLERLVGPSDAERLCRNGVRLSELARSGQPGASALLPVSSAGRGVLDAAFELARRRHLEEAPPGTCMREAAEVAALLGPVLRDEPVEVFRTVLLDARHRVLAFPEVSRGTLGSSLVHPREVLRPALVVQAAALLVVHNHPSGVSEPSHQDDAVTRRLARAADVVGIPLLDHVILGEGCYHSYRESMDPALNPRS